MQFDLVNAFKVFRVPFCIRIKAVAGISVRVMMRSSMTVPWLLCSKEMWPKSLKKLQSLANISYVFYTPLALELWKIWKAAHSREWKLEIWNAKF